MFPDCMALCDTDRIGATGVHEIMFAFLFYGRDINCNFTYLPTSNFSQSNYIRILLFTITKVRDKHDNGKPICRTSYLMAVVMFALSLKYFELFTAKCI